MDIINHLKDCILYIKRGQAESVCWRWTRDDDQPDCEECQRWFTRCKINQCPDECYSNSELIKITQDGITFHKSFIK